VNQPNNKPTPIPTVKSRESEIDYTDPEEVAWTIATYGMKSPRPTDGSTLIDIQATAKIIKEVIAALFTERPAQQWQRIEELAFGTHAVCYRADGTGSFCRRS
jgi:hypothetical protein